MKEKVRKLIFGTLIITAINLLILGTSGVRSYAAEQGGTSLHYPAGTPDESITVLDEVRVEKASGKTGAEKRKAPKRADSSEHGYYYGALNEAEKRYYDALVQAAKLYPTGISEEEIQDHSYTSSVEFFTTSDESAIISKEERQNTTFAFFEDFPEYYYVSQTGMVTFYIPEDDGTTTYQMNAYIKIKDGYTEELVQTESAAIDSAAESFLAGIGLTKSQPVVELEIHDKLIQELQYNYAALEADNTEIHAHDLYGALVGHNVVCDGYSKAFQYLCQKAGLTCIRIRGEAGEASATGNHAWNLVKLNGEWYEVDPTWDDQDYEEYQHTFFNLTTAQISDVDGDVHVRSTGKVWDYAPTANGTEYTYGKVLELQESEKEEQPSVQFTDVNENQYFYDAVMWGVNSGAVAGYSEPDGTHTFRPNDTCTRAQFVTFLWRTLGEKQPTSTENPFKDISDIGSQYYGTALLWAYENHYVSGYSDPDGVRFGPDDQITRGQVVTFLWRAAGEPKAAATKSPFKDVTKPEEQYYGQAMLWASENGVVSGYSDSDGVRFAADDACTRGQVVTFLWRYAQKYLK